jgi:hypothetical protein
LIKTDKNKRKTLKRKTLMTTIRRGRERCHAEKEGSEWEKTEEGEEL